MKMLRSFLLLAFIGPVLAWPVLASTEENISKTLPAQSGGTLVVDVDMGSVDVATHSRDEVSIEVWRKVTRRSKSEEQAYLKERPVKISADNGTVTILTKGKPTRSVFSLFRGGSTSAKYTVRVPEKFNARVTTAGGGIKVAGLVGEVKAHTSGGGLDFQRLRGPLEGNTSGGGVKASECEGALKLSTSGGSISVNSGVGTLNGSTSGGGITVKDFSGETTVHTSGGSITLENLASALSASTSGGSVYARLPHWEGAPVKLSTSGGSIEVQMPAQTAFNLDAETSGGGVRSELPVVVTGKVQRESLKGPVNGGGNTVHLRTSGGSINVKKLPTT